MRTHSRAKSRRKAADAGEGVRSWIWFLGAILSFGAAILLHFVRPEDEVLTGLYGGFTELGLQVFFGGTVATIILGLVIESALKKRCLRKRMERAEDDVPVEREKSSMPCDDESE